MTIAVVDDEQIQQKLITRMISNWTNRTNNKALIKAFDSAESFLFTYEGDKSVDILLLDIQMKSMDGIALAKKIRTENEEMQIVFITGIPDFIAEGYEVSALNYLMKPIKEDKFFAVLDRAVLKLKATPQTILLPKPGGNVRIKADDILYIEVISHTVSFHLLDGEETVRMRIADIKELLGKSFFQCHRSYIVSLKYVSRVTRTAMVLSARGQALAEIPLSRSLYDEANQVFINFN